jgi:hypothetical protein
VKIFFTDRLFDGSSILTLQRIDMDRRSEQFAHSGESRTRSSSLMHELYGSHSHTGESSESTTGKHESQRQEHVTPRLLLSEDKDFMTVGTLQKSNPSWYQKLTSEQRENVHKHIRDTTEDLDLENASYYTVKEVLRKSGVDLRQSVGDPSQFGEREIVLAGGYPRDSKSLSHITRAYDKNHNLTVYDTIDQPVPPRFLTELEESGRAVEFKLNQMLRSMGEVEHHDILIPHPGPKWVESSLADELDHVLGHDSKAYILTDTFKGQKDKLVEKLQQQDRLETEVTYRGEVAEQDIMLGNIAIHPTQPGPYYIVEVRPREPFSET